MKVKKLTLAYHSSALRNTTPYEVVRVEHTTEYVPGNMLSKRDVDDLNVNRNWHVVVVAAKQGAAMYSFIYFQPQWTAGYSGFVRYGRDYPYWENEPCNTSYWMIPGTYEYDWDNR